MQICIECWLQRLWEIVSNTDRKRLIQSRLIWKQSVTTFHPLHIFIVGYHYRPQRSCSQGNVFTRVCHSVHRGGVCLSACWDTTPPPQEQTNPPEADTPWKQTPPRSRHPPWGRHPLEADTPREQTPPQEADSSIQSTTGRYASYWNAFLFYDISTQDVKLLIWIIIL